MRFIESAGMIIDGIKEYLETKKELRKAVDFDDKRKGQYSLEVYDGKGEECKGFSGINYSEPEEATFKRILTMDIKQMVLRVSEEEKVIVSNRRRNIDE